MKPNKIKIVTVDSANGDVLRKKTEDIKPDELYLAQEIGEKLLSALKPHLPAAGLAAPQIGISKSVFVYSYNREPENLEIVINPAFIPIGDKKIHGWEGCFSIILSDTVWQLALVPRYEKIKVSYLNPKGEKTEKVLEGFASKAFQHEYDHLQGIENVERNDATVKTFSSREELFTFLQQVKKEDSDHYTKPMQTK
jgi:peptide deformylase